MRHYEESVFIAASPRDLFQHVDNQTRLSSRMSGASWMMGGGRMSISTDAGRGEEVGSHIRLEGKAFGIPVHLEEVVVEQEPPYHKAWKTIGDLNLLVIGHYQMAFNIKEEGSGSRFTIRDSRAILLWLPEGPSAAFSRARGHPSARPPADRTRPGMSQPGT